MFFWVNPFVIDTLNASIARAIAIRPVEIKLNAIKTADFPTLAKRPQRSTMALDKIEKLYGVEPEDWENSLEECITILKTPAE